MDAVDVCNNLLGSWRGQWYAISGDLDKASQGLDSVDPAGSLFRLFPGVKLDVFRNQMNSITTDANNSVQLVPKVVKSLEDGVEAACNVHINLGPWGGRGGSPFADPIHDYKDALVKLHVYCGDYVDSFQCFYVSGSGYKHGGGGGRPVEVDLKPGENVVRIAGTFKDYLHTISFYSNMGRHWDFGSNRGTDSFDVSAEDGVLQSITGRSGKYMDQISFVFTTSPYVNAKNLIHTMGVVRAAVTSHSVVESAAVHHSAPNTDGIDADIDYAVYLQKV